MWNDPTRAGGMKNAACSDLISACGDGQRRVRGLQSPRAAFFFIAKEKFLFHLRFAHLFITLTFVEVTLVRKHNTKKILFSFVFRSLIRNFAPINRMVG